MSEHGNETPAPPEGATAYPPNAGTTGTGVANASPATTQRPSEQDAVSEADAKRAEKEHEKDEKHRAKEQRKKNGGGFWKPFASGAVGAVVILALVGALWTWTPLFNGMKGSSGVGGTITIENSEGATTAEAVAAKTINSVVTIYTYSNNSSWNQYFDNGGSSSSPDALGSGVIISNEGNDCYILTNYHVVENISKAVVKVGDQQYEATAVGADAKTDLAVIKINASGLTPMEWGDSSEVTVGEWVMAIGSPYGYENTVTTGIVSALYRSDVLSSSDGLGTTVYTDMIQTDAAINPGNSGGALVDSEGKLIGINTYISSTSQSSAGLGFAIPSNEAKQIADQLMQGKEVSHASLGVTIQDSSDPQGAKVASVFKDTAADKAGLQTGDVITKIDGQSVSSSNDVSVAVSSKAEGDTISITYVRNGQENTTEATLGSDSDQATEYAENGKPETDPSAASGGSNGSYGGGYGYGGLFDYLFGDSGNGYGSGSGGSNGQNGGSFWN